MKKNEIMGVIQQHLTVENSFVKNIYVENKSGDVVTNFGYNYRFKDCHISSLRPDDKDPVGVGENGIHIHGGSIKNVTLVNSFLIVDGSLVITKFVAYRSRIIIKSRPEELGEFKTIVECHCPMQFEQCDIEFHDVLFTGNALFVCKDCRVNLYGCSIEIGTLSRPITVRGKEFYFHGGNVNIGESNGPVFYFCNCVGELAQVDMSIGITEAVLDFSKSDMGLQNCSIVLEKGFIIHSCTSTVRHDGCYLYVNEGICIVTEKSHIRLRNCRLVAMGCGAIDVYSISSTVDIYGGDYLALHSVIYAIYSAFNCLESIAYTSELDPAIYLIGGFLIADRVQVIQSLLNSAFVVTEGGLVELLGDGTYSSIRPPLFLSEGGSYIIRGNPTLINPRTIAAGSGLISFLP